MAKNEMTSSRVAKIAGRILKKLDAECGVDPKAHDTDRVLWEQGRTGSGGAEQVCTLAELKAVCASALTQAKDK